MAGLSLLEKVAAIPNSAGFEAEATSAFAAMSVQPDTTRKGHYNTLIAGLKSDGVWAKLDWLSLIAAHDAQAARLNLVNPVQVMTAVNSPTFTTDRGYTGNGSTQYLSTGFNPSTGTPKFARDDAHMGVWAGTAVSDGSWDLGTTNQASIASNGFGSLRCKANANDGPISAVATSIGFTLWTRRASNANEAYKNGVSAGTNGTASVATPNAEFLVGASNSSTTGTITPANYSSRRIQAVVWGSQLSAAQQLALYDRLAAYMTAVGA